MTPCATVSCVLEAMTGPSAAPNPAASLGHLRILHEPVARPGARALSKFLFGL